MYKRGVELQIFFIMELIVAVFAGLLFINAGKAWAQVDYYDKVRIAEDIALGMNALYSVPGNADLRYINEVSDYIITIKDDYVLVAKSEYDVIPGKYHFVKKGTQEFNYVFNHPTTLVLVKNGDSITIKAYNEEK